MYEGAQNNLPDQAAMHTAQRIQSMITNSMCTADILLVLISGKFYVYKVRDKNGKRERDDFLSSVFLLDQGIIGQTLGPDFENNHRNVVVDDRC